MATLLYRLGRFSYLRRWIVAPIWLAVVVLLGVAAATLSDETTDSFAIPGTESQQAIDLLEERFPQSAADGSTARIAFQAPEGEALSDPANEQAVNEVMATLGGGPQVAQAVNPIEAGLISEDGTIAFGQVSYTGNALQLTEETKDDLSSAAETGRDAGLTVEVGGDAVEEAPEVGAELVGLAVAALVLFFTFGSLLAAGMPLLTGIIGVAIGVSAVTASTGFIEIGSTTPILATMLGLAVAIDYALFIVSRYRHELSIGRPGDEAAGRAIGTAGSAVVFAGLTVMIALVGLAVLGIPLVTQMGVAAAMTVGIAVLIALTLLPALLGFAGGRVAPKSRRRTASHVTKPSWGRRWVNLITARPIATLVAAVGVLVLAAVPVVDIRFGIPDQGTYPSDTSARKAYDLIAQGFGPGFNGPLTVVVDGNGQDVSAAADEVSTTLGEMDGVAAVDGPVPNEAGDTALLSVIPTTGPDTSATKELVDTIRSDGAAVESADVAVTGITAIYIDFNEKMAGALIPYLLLVVGLSFVLLMIVFRSLVVPLKAALGFLLSVTATFGALVAVFQWGWLEGIGIEPTGQVVSMLPILIIGVVFGLAMDYEVFLVTRMREEYVHGADALTAVREGYQHGARVVAAAAMIMFSVFAGFVLGDAADIVQMGFAFAIAIVFDAFIVRMTIVPAVLALVGDRAWSLPRWLDRVLPNVDVEGERLSHYLDTRESATIAK